VRALRVPVIGLALALALALGGCAVRPAPYRFASPLVGGVSLDERAEHGRSAARAADDAVAPAPAVAIAEVPGRRVPGASDGDVVSGTRTEISDLLGEPGAVEIARLPEPHREPRPKPGEERIGFDGLDDADDLRGLVGRRDGRGDVAFAVAAARVLREGAIAAPADAAALVELARTRDALAPPSEVRAAPGDLLVFERAVEGGPLVAVVLTRDDARDVLEMLYLAGGVVRRGFVAPAQPRMRRDAEGRILNTFLRHNGDHPPEGTRFLAGELLAHVVRWDLLR